MRAHSKRSGEFTRLDSRESPRSPSTIFRRLWELYQRRPRLKSSRFGRWYIAVTFAVGGAAVNSGNNLLFLLFSALLSLIIFSGQLSSQTLSRLRLQAPRFWCSSREMNLSAVATLWNRKRRLPSLLLSLSEPTLRPLAGLAHTYDPSATQYPPQRIFSLAPQANTALTFPRSLPRGLYLFTGLWVKSDAPFGLFSKSLYLSCSPETLLLVLPERPLDVEVERGRVSTDQTLAAQLSWTEREQPQGGGGELERLRPFRGAEPLSMIHWKSSARRGDLLIAERQGEALVRATPPEEGALWPSGRTENRQIRCWNAAIHWLESAEGERERRLWVPLRLFVCRGEGGAVLLERLERSSSGPPDSASLSSKLSILLREGHRAPQRGDLAWRSFEPRDAQLLIALAALMPSGPPIALEELADAPMTDPLPPAEIGTLRCYGDPSVELPTKLKERPLSPSEEYLQQPLYDSQRLSARLFSSLEPLP